ncbi:MAG: CPBP family intramembrane metalloprotease [Lachnospiraceae bacterium]|jgi:membrane protease YdiL (CAAX protease family)|nr:CPBP family intramembrane metalloprotease [Lachnospiraceae bacterium]MCI9591319.1 CPBP family intramembrane metalloprotease [Lachnospiraceae bacterium]MDE6929879.1 CPBP family intramembrane metalloprotease [Lachnospiraceae bacterium]
MERIRSALRAALKTVYPLMIYYMSVFAFTEIYRTAGFFPEDTVAVILPGAVLTAGILWFPYKKDWILRQGLVKELRLKAPHHWEHLIILGISSSITGNLLLSFTPLARWFPAVEEAVREIADSGFWLQLTGVCLIIPVAEELIFRGIGYLSLRDEMGVVPAAVFSSGFFGLFHGNLVQGIYAAGLGLILAFVMEKYQSLTAVWLTHAAMNIGSVYVLNGILMPVSAEIPALSVFMAVLALGIAAAEIRRLQRTDFY